MRRWIGGGLGFIFLIFFLLVCKYLAGPAGILLGIFISLSVILVFLSYLGIFTLPHLARRISYWVIGIGLLSITSIWLATAIISQLAKKEPPTSTVAVSTAPTAIAPFEEFILKVGEPVQTVEAGPGTHHRIQSDKKFIAVSIQLDGSEKRYEMPAGTSYLNGRAPWGRILLEGLEDGTRVKIVPIN